MAKKENKDIGQLSIEELRDAYSKLQADNEALTTDLKTAKDASQKLSDENTKLKGEKTELEGKLTNADKDLQEALKLNAELQSDLENVPKPNQKPSVKYDGKTYEVVIPKLRHNGVTIGYEQLKNDKALVAELVKMQSGMLKLKKEDK